MAVMATLLVIYGDNLNRLVKKQLRDSHFIIRTIIFVLICTFAYGALLIYVTPLLTKLLYSFSMIYLGPFIVAVFISLGLIAEKKHYL